jgi:hypothetical protein
MLAPPFTPEAARLNGIKSGEARRRRRDELDALRKAEAEARAKQSPVQDMVEARQRRVLTQIDSTLDRLNDCDDDVLRVKLVAALDTLWNLVWPRAGVSKPQRSGQRRTAPSVEPAPQAPSPAPSQPPV